MRLEELKIYNIAVRLRNELHKEISLIPNNWRIKDVKQIRESSASISSNIAEGFGRRFYPKDFIRFLIIALGSSEETKNHIGSLLTNKHLSEERTDYFIKSYRDLSVRIVNFINYKKQKINNCFPNCNPDGIPNSSPNSSPNSFPNSSLNRK